MSITSLTAYLNFDGDAADAIELYKTHLGATATQIMKFADMEGHPFGPEANSRIMHAELKLGEIALLLCDIPPTMERSATSHTHVNLSWDDVEAMTKAFEGLAEGGEVTMALHDAFWGAKFGMLTDAFGIRWMFNCPTK